MATFDVVAVVFACCFVVEDAFEDGVAVLFEVDEFDVACSFRCVCGFDCRDADDDDEANNDVDACCCCRRGVKDALETFVEDVAAAFDFDDDASNVGFCVFIVFIVASVEGDEADGEKDFLLRLEGGIVIDVVFFFGSLFAVDDDSNGASISLRKPSNLVSSAAAIAAAASSSDS